MAELTDEMRAFLAERRYAVLATRDPDTTIHLTPVWYMFDGEVFLFESFSGSRKIKNLERDPAVSVLVDARQPANERWVSASGTAEIVSGDEAQRINAEIRRRYLTEDARGDERIEPVFAAGDDVTIRFTPARWLSWQARDLDDQFFGGVLGQAPERWFLPVDA
jgi:PPOX class probable F420-dependent enzyme